MNQVDKLDAPKPGPPRSSKKRTELIPFAAVDFNPNDPWRLCGEYQDCIPITYGLAADVAKALTRGLSADERFLAVHQRRVVKFKDGRAFRIQFKSKRGAVVGGRIWMKNTRGQTIQLNDVKGLFQLTWRQTKRLYGTDDLALIMEHVRRDLDNVGLGAYHQNWWLCSSITDFLWKECQKKYESFDLSNVPKIINLRPNEPGNLQGYNVFGHAERPVHFYDIHSAYLSVMAQSTIMKPFTDRLWNARCALQSAMSPTSFLVKLAATILPGKFVSTIPGNRFYRPDLGKFISQTVNDRLRKAMSCVWAPGDVYRWCVDGFIAAEDISRHLDIGPNLGQWKPVETHSYLTIAKTNVWWTDKAHKDGGFNRISRQQVLDNPFRIETSRTIFDWSTLEEKTQSVLLGQYHSPSRCRECWDGEGVGTLHDIAPDFSDLAILEDD